MLAALSTLDRRELYPECSALIAGGKVDLCFKDIFDHHKDKGQAYPVPCSHRCVEVVYTSPQS